ncbi:MAG: hypothetical protein IJS34_01440 [Alphaproteobacteria bacterium]|nr:hypothetical protein [Alphaproteobacteria bacterium]
MKYLLLSLLVLGSCSLFREQDTNWTPAIKTEEVGCCITEQQVHGAIYYALLKLKWDIRNRTDNSFTTNIQCSEQKIDVLFKNTDKEYTIAVENKIKNIYEYRYCIESHTNKVNKYIKKYLKNAITKAAKKELSGIK